jgi:hypothetical protein
MKLTITKRETQEIEVTFPFYKKESGDYFKGKSADEWITIRPLISSISICHEPYLLSEILLGEDITEDEFNEKFVEVFNKIKSYKPQYSVI